MLHQLLEAGGLAKGQPGPCQQGVLHPAGAVRVGGVSPPLDKAITVLFSGVAEAALAIVLEGISCESAVM